MFDINHVEVKNNVVLINFKEWEYREFFSNIKRIWDTSRLQYLYEKKRGAVFGRGKAQLHIDNFFLPDICYLLEKMVTDYNRKISFSSKRLYNTLIEELYEKTWMSNTVKQFPSIVNKSLYNDFNKEFLPKHYQEEFHDLYDNKKQQFLLNGYILGFDTGLGKTLTSITLMHILKKQKIIIIAPNNTLRDVWEREINRIFKDKQSVFVIGNEIIDARWNIFNYEAMDKFYLIEEYCKRYKNIGIIVDECHNFRNNEAKRVIELRNIQNKTKCKDMLMMSGTPVKALGSEIIPVMSVLDNFYTEEVGVIYKKVFGTNKAVALDVINNRIGNMMHRKMKKDVLDGLPQKFEKTLSVKTKNGNKFTLNNVKTICAKFIDDRNKFYTSHANEYEKKFWDALDYFEKNCKYRKDEFIKYWSGVKFFKRNKYAASDPYHRDLAKILNSFEKSVIIPQLPQPYKNNFKESKTVVKYVHLKIMGEVIGGLLSKLRVEMITEMAHSMDMKSFIDNAEKKTIMFTDYVDVLKSVDEYLRKELHYKTVVVYGENTKDIVHNLNNFKSKPEYNPLIATGQTLSTGTTLIEANNMLMLNKPWRHTDYIQRSDRIFRIGQDTDVYITSLLLDTGTEPNLSTRMEDIVKWSEEMFIGIIGEEKIEEEVIEMSTEEDYSYIDCDYYIDELYVKEESYISCSFNNLFNLI